MRMIDWNTISVNQELSINIIENGRTYKLKGKLVQYEWSLHRIPVLANIQVIESDDIKLLYGDIIRLPMITNCEENSFLVSCPRPLQKKPANQIKIKARIILN